MTRFHLTRSQMDVVEAFEGGDLADVEFFELAANAGMGFDDIAEAMAEQRVQLEVAGSGTMK